MSVLLYHKANKQTNDLKFQNLKVVGSHSGVETVVLIGCAVTVQLICSLIFRIQEMRCFPNIIYFVLTGKWDDWQGQDEGADYYEPHVDDPDFNVSYYRSGASCSKLN